MSFEIEPPVIAHRGASAYAPENTIAAFTKAAQLGVKWVEFDVTEAACGEPVIFHDEQLDRTTNGHGVLSHYPYSYLHTLDAGAWFDPVFSGERIPSLRETMEFLQSTKLSANIEIKPVRDQAEPLVLRIIDEVTPFLIKNEDVHIIFSSFSVEVLMLLRKAAPQFNIGLLLDKWKPHWQEVAAELSCAAIHVNEKIITPRSAGEIKKLGYTLLCYTVNDPKRAFELYTIGVDALFSDNPDLILVNNGRKF